MIRFVTDSSSDMTACPEHNLAIVPLTIYNDSYNWTDDASLNVSEMVDILASYRGRTYTSCPSTQSWLDAFEGADEIYATTVTSELSGAFNSALIARNMYLAEHPDARILIVNSLTTGAELQLITEELMEMKQSGMTFDEIEREIAHYMKKTRLFFAFRSLHNLAENGRVNKAAAAALGLLNISIFGTASRDGHVEPLTKCHGDRKVLQEILQQLTDAGYHGGKLRISHVDNPQLAEKVAALAREHFRTTDIRIFPSRGLVSYYAERGGIILGCECE